MGGVRSLLSMSEWWGVIVVSERMEKHGGW